MIRHSPLSILRMMGKTLSFDWINFQHISFAAKSFNRFLCSIIRTVFQTTIWKFSWRECLANCRSECSSNFIITLSAFLSSRAFGGVNNLYFQVALLTYNRIAVVNSRHYTQREGKSLSIMILNSPFAYIISLSRATLCLAWCSLPFSIASIDLFKFQTSFIVCYSRIRNRAVKFV